MAGAGWVLLQAKALETKDSVVDVSPLTGVIPPYGKVPLVVKFHPQQTAPARGFSANPQPPERQSKTYQYAVQVGLQMDDYLPARAQQWELFHTEYKQGCPIAYSVLLA